MEKHQFVTERPKVFETYLAITIAAGAFPIVWKCGMSKVESF